MDFIERLRTKSPETRSRYAFLVALCITGVVGFLWVLALPARFSTVGKISPEDLKPAVPELPQLIDEGKDQLGSIIEGALQDIPTETEEIPRGDETLPNLPPTTHTTGGEGVATATPNSQIAPTRIATTTTPKTVAIPVGKPGSTTPTNTPAAPKNIIIQIATTSAQKSE